MDPWAQCLQIITCSGSGKESYKIIMLKAKLMHQETRRQQVWYNKLFIIVVGGDGLEWRELEIQRLTDKKIPGGKVEVEPGVRNWNQSIQNWG